MTVDNDLAGDGLVVAYGQARDQCFKALLDAQAVTLGVTIEALLFDRNALIYNLIDQLRVLVGEESPYAVEVGVHQRLDELAIARLRLSHDRKGMCFSRFVVHYIRKKLVGLTG